MFPDWVEVLVPESEEELYKTKIVNPIITIPDSYIGLGAVRNWCLDNFKEETVIMIDDDLVSLYCVGSGKKSRRIWDKEEAVQVLIADAVMAKDMGVHIFGYNQRDIRGYNPTQPFKLATWVGGVIGIVGRAFRFRDDKYKVDIDYCMKCLLVDRIILQDCRYVFYQGRDNNVGGNSAFRSQEEYDKSLETLQTTWGKY